MNSPINGTVWLLYIGVFIALLLIIALVRKPKQQKTLSKTFKDKPDSDMRSARDIVKLNKLLNKHFPKLSTTLRRNRIVAQDSRRKIMLTIDRKVSKGSRQLGDALVINFHRLPSVNELKQAIT